MAEETVNVNPDGSTTFEGGEESTMPPVEDTEGMFDEETMADAVVGVDPAIYLLLVTLVLGVLYFIYYRRSHDNEDEFFTDLDGEKVSETQQARDTWVLSIFS
jgi:hypothetical protein